MPSNPPTILAHKSAFLRTQIRTLSTPLKASTTVPPPASESHTPLPSNVTDDIISKVNKKITSHNRLVFPAQSQRHVAEQIDTLYWQEVLAVPGLLKVGEDEVVLGVGADLTEISVVHGLPETLADARVGMRGAGGGESKLEEEYVRLREKLVEQVQKLEKLRVRLDGCRKLQETLRPFENARVEVQPNLVTRDGELDGELDRMRVLLARVTSRLGSSSALESVGAEEKRLETEDMKLAHVLGLG